MAPRPWSRLHSCIAFLDIKQPRDGLETYGIHIRTSFSKTFRLMRGQNRKLSSALPATFHQNRQKMVLAPKKVWPTSSSSLAFCSFVISKYATKNMYLYQSARIPHWVNCKAEAKTPTGRSHRTRRDHPPLRSQHSRLRKSLVGKSQIELRASATSCIPTLLKHLAWHPNIF